MSWNIRVEQFGVVSSNRKAIVFSASPGQSGLDQPSLAAVLDDLEHAAAVFVEYQTQMRLGICEERWSGKPKPADRWPGFVDTDILGLTAVVGFTGIGGGWATAEAGLRNEEEP